MYHAADGSELPIRRQKGVLGGSAVIAGTRVPVYMIEKIYREQGLKAVIDGYPQLSEDEIVAALTFARNYPDEVQRDWQEVIEAFERTPLAMSVPFQG